MIELIMMCFGAFMLGYFWDKCMTNPKYRPAETKKYNVEYRFTAIDRMPKPVGPPNRIFKHGLFGQYEVISESGIQPSKPWPRK